MTALKIQDEFGIVTERKRQREVFAKFIKPAVEDYLASPTAQARITREVNARVRREVDAIVAQRARERLEQVKATLTSSGPPIAEILALVSAVTGVSVPDIVGPRRQRRLAQPRFFAVHMMLEMRPDLSTPAIGRVLGGRDHTSVLHARNVFRRDIDYDPYRSWLADPRTQKMLADKPELIAARHPMARAA